MRKSEITTKESIRESVRSIRYMSLMMCLVLVIGMIGIRRDAVRADSSASKEQTSLVADEYSIQGVYYRTQVQDIGWQDYVGNGESAGTIGQSKRLEAIQIKLQGIPGSIEYRTHVQDAGWQEWVANDSVSGTVGMCKRLEAIEIRLTGEAEEAYDVCYRVHAQNVGWMGWAQNGAAAGTAGYSCRLEAIEIRLVPKGEAAPGSADGCFIERYASVIAVRYRTHVQDIGWQDYVENGEVAGTIGQARRLEGIQIKLQNAVGGIEYSTHIQDIGWTNYVSNDAMSGTSGQSKHLEAIKIRLTEPAAKVYDVYYRVHAQNFGWLGWTENGNPAGTTGYSYRLEAIEIRLVEKGAEAPGKTIRAFVEYSPSTPSPSDRPVYVNGFLDPRSVTPTMVSDASPLTVLVNKFYCVSKDYVPSLVPAKSSKQCYLRPEAADAWNLMRAACYDATGKTLYLSSGYRSYATQKFIFENAIANKGLERAISKYAYPGRSEHQLGLALDIATTDYKSISGSFLKTTAGQWMVEHAHEYGFILRYPSGKESITGYAFEAWHFRYVGVDPATAMHNSGQTFEEYLGKA